MYAYIPCPVELLPTDSGRVSRYDYSRYDRITGMERVDAYDGFWVGTQDPSLISQYPRAVVGVDKTQALEALEIKLGTPPKFTRVSDPENLSTSALRIYSANDYVCQNEKSDPQIRLRNDRLRELIKKLDGGKVASNYASWCVHPVLPVPECLDKDVPDWEVMAEAKLRGTDGVLVSDDRFDMPDKRNVEPVANGFLVERTPLGCKLVYNPKRYKALATRRNKAVSGQGALRMACTAYDCVRSMALALSDNLFDDRNLRRLAYSNWSCRGIDACADATVALWHVHVRMHDTKVARKLIAKHLKAAHWHRRRYSATFNKWMDSQLKFVGVPPESSKSKYQARQVAGGVLLK